MHFARILVPVLLGSVTLGSTTLIVSTAEAALYSPQQALSTQSIQQFLANPATLLSQFPDGGGQMISQVRDLVASDPTTLSALVALLSSASPAQAQAIGTGLGQAAVMAVKSDQAFANQIQTAVVQSQITSAVVAFSAVVGGDIQLAAAGPGGGGGGGGGESATASTGTVSGVTAPINFNLGTSRANVVDSFPSITLSVGSPVSPTGR